MGTLASLYELITDSSYKKVQEEAAKEVGVALAGNSLEVRNQLYNALSRPMESLWTANPFRVIEVNENPTAGQEEGGVLLYALNENSRISQDKQKWLKEIALSPNTAIIIAVLPGLDNEVKGAQGNFGQRLQALNPLRLVGGNPGENQIPTGVGADGASTHPFEEPTRPVWEIELGQLERESAGKLSVVFLSGLNLNKLDHELLPLIIKSLPGREIALARRAPAFRNPVANHFINQAARSNAQNILMANLTSGIPLIGDLFGGGADFVLLTKSQFELIHRLSNIYGEQREGWVELYLELAPVVVGAIIWRNISRGIGQKLPGFTAILPKGIIAFLATFGVGKLAQLYYASGRKGPGEISTFLRNLLEKLTGQTQVEGKDGDYSPRRLKSI